MNMEDGVGDLVCDSDTTLNVKEAIRISVVDIVEQVKLFHPFRIDPAESLLIFGVALPYFSI